QSHADDRRPEPARGRCGGAAVARYGLNEGLAVQAEAEPAMAWWMSRQRWAGTLAGMSGFLCSVKLAVLMPPACCRPPAALPGAPRRCCGLHRARRRPG